LVVRGLSVGADLMETPEVLMRFAGPMFGIPVAPWHRWFAWYPVRTIDGRFAWLRWIWRARYQSKAYLDGPTIEWFVTARVDGYGD
jgi:hypothetical protein